MTRQKPLNLLPIPQTGLVPSAQPFSHLFRITTHFSTELFQGQAVDLFVPAQFFHNIVRTGYGIVTEKSDDLGDVPEIDGPSVLPVPDGRGGHSDLGRDILLVQPEFETAPAKVVAEGDWFLSEL